jgi:hypothetical protein
MMRTTAWLLVACLGALGAPFARADNLVANGGFEMPFAPDWEQSSTALSFSVDRGVAYDPDPDYEAHILQNTGLGWVRLGQTVWIPETDVEFSASINLYSYATSTAWAGAALVIEYLDASEVRLGETRIGNWTHYCAWVDSPDQHLIGMPASTWTNYGFNIDDELENLPAVDPRQVRFLRVSLFTDIYDC